ncbi:hypothetical protein Slin15195_G058020 [Septoria linicola]|uniref:Uncharacterized protein n=1 Tax=Septoria linicola TaxID=215465 RepID=A0A9Q9AUQ7_9PEZI|nr:hypothetical protein Slin14017_G073870 [Septoria linicola]USW52483.1 hypothetical protein Slin15195_G058020 [Septoria linicola]
MSHKVTWTACDALRRLIAAALHIPTTGSLYTTQPTNIESVAFDVSVQGFASDNEPTASGAPLMANIVRTLHNAQIECCFAGVAALVYYGAHRTMQDWTLCIEDSRFAAAEALLESPSGIIEPWQQSSMKPNGTIEHRFPRFKFKGFRCLFHIVPGWLFRLTCSPDTIEFSKLGLPFPRLDVLAQSLLETINRVDLQDLVDGMALSYEWGLENLQLDGLSDTDWAARRLDFHEGSGDWAPVLLRREGASKLATWNRVASAEARAKGRRHKEMPRDETRFRFKGQKDPRELHNW